MNINSNMLEIKASKTTIEKLFAEKNPTIQSIEQTFMRRVELPSKGSVLLKLSHGDVIHMYNISMRSKEMGIHLFILDVMYCALVEGEAVYELVNIRRASNLEFMAELDAHWADGLSLDF